MKGPALQGLLGPESKKPSRDMKRVQAASECHAKVVVG